MSTTLADHFLKDLEELSADEDEVLLLKEKEEIKREEGEEDSDNEPISDAIEEYLQRKSLQ